MRSGRQKTIFMISLCACAIFVTALLVAPLLITADPNATDLSNALRAPGTDGFALGSDQAGRDVLLRTLAGGRESVILGFGVLLVVVVVGTLAGLLGGYAGGALDYLVNKVVTAFQAFPSFVLAVAIAGMLGQGTINMIIAIAAVYWTQFARLTRSIAISFKKSDCLKAARMCGAKTPSIILKYLVPEIAGPVAIMGALSMSDIILTMAGLSFIGLGPERPTNEWGTMIAEAQPTFQYALWCMIVPMCALFIAVVLFNFLGDSLRDALDARNAPYVSQTKPSFISGFLNKRRGRRNGKPIVET